MTNVLKTIRLIWAAFCFQPLLFGVVLAVADTEPDDALYSLLPVFSIVVLGELGFLAFWRWRHFGSTLGFAAPQLLRVTERANKAELADAVEAAAPRLQTTVLVGLAIAVSIAMYGFVLGFSTGNPLLYVPFAAVSLIALLAQFPTETALGCMLSPSEAKAFFDTRP